MYYAGRRIEVCAAEKNLVGFRDGSAGKHRPVLIRGTGLCLFVKWFHDSGRTVPEEVKRRVGR